MDEKIQYQKLPDVQKQRTLFMCLTKGQSGDWKWQVLAQERQMLIWMFVESNPRSHTERKDTAM